jgi:hypothetical protein
MGLMVISQSREEAACPYSPLQTRVSHIIAKEAHTGDAFADQSLRSRQSLRSEHSTALQMTAGRLPVQSAFWQPLYLLQEKHSTLGSLMLKGLHR